MRFFLFRGAQACRWHRRLDSASRGVYGWGGGSESRTGAGMCVHDHASAVSVRDKTTSRDDTRAVALRCPADYRPPNIQNYTCGRHAPSVTLKDRGADSGQVRKTVISATENLCVDTGNSLEVWKRCCSGMKDWGELFARCRLSTAKDSA